MTTRTEHMQNLLKKHEVDDDCVWELEQEMLRGHLRRFALVQLEVMTDRVWITTHDTLADVSSYVFGEEVPWQTEYVLDLYTGRIIHPTGYTWPDIDNTQKEA